MRISGELKKQYIDSVYTKSLRDVCLRGFFYACFFVYCVSNFDICDFNFRLLLRFKIFVSVYNLHVQGEVLSYK